MSSAQQQTEEKNQVVEQNGATNTPWFRRLSWHTTTLYVLLVGVSVGFAWYTYSTKREAELKQMRLREKVKLLNRFRASPGGSFEYH